MGGKRGRIPWAVGLAAAALGPIGCAPAAVIEDVVALTAPAVYFEAAEATAPAEVAFRFSRAVALRRARFDPPLEVASSRGGDTALTLSFATPLAEGARYVGELEVEDDAGNRLMVLTPFLALNRRLPRCLITEIRTEYSKPKVEFVEIVTESAGNLGGMALFCAGAGLGAPVYVFPPVEAAAGERLVVHLRTLDPASRDETGGLADSAGVEASPDARDFWVAGAVERLRRSDAVWLAGPGGDWLDAVLFSEAAEGEWKTEALAEAAAAAAVAGAWKTADGQPPRPADAASSAGTTVTRSLCRSGGDTDGPADWYVAASGGATPGAPNKAGRYLAAPAKPSL